MGKGITINGQELRHRRENAGYTLTYLAQRAHISPTYLSQVERGLRSPSPPVAADIAHALGVPLEELR
jgi:transcriptional regulator with XRE-family HTH domain